MSYEPSYAMCPGCRRANFETHEAAQEQGSCPYCGTALWERAQRCCMPDCEHMIPNNGSMPLCRDCGIKVALRHMHDASLHDAVLLEKRRITEASRRAERQGRTGQAVVYYVRLDAERIKIGFTSHLHDRLKALRAAPGALLAVEPGGRELEKQRHHQFRSERINTQREDFAVSDRLLGWVEEVAAAHPQPKMLPDTKTVTIRRKAS